MRSFGGEHTCLHRAGGREACGMLRLRGTELPGSGGGSRLPARRRVDPGISAWRWGGGVVMFKFISFEAGGTVWLLYPQLLVG